jgi:ketosteroid isomerase-like protein
MITEEQARKFTGEWIAAWNGRDLDAVLAHYCDDIVFHSPRIAQVMGERWAAVHGKAELSDYWSRALAAAPHLHFELEEVLLGSDCLTILYRNHRQQRVAETFLFDESGLVTESFAAYA